MPSDSRERRESRDSRDSRDSDYRYYKYYKYYKYYRHYRRYNIYLPVREAKPKRSFIRGDWQSRSGVLASKGVEKSSLAEAEGLSSLQKQRDAAVSIL